MLLGGAMGRKLRTVLILAACAVCCVYGISYSFSAFAEDVAPKRAAAKLTCGSHSSNPTQFKAFQVDLQFDVTGSLWLLDWKTERAEVKFRGILSPSGTMLIAGLGKSDEGATWTYEFSGQKKPTGIAILNGSMQSEQPKGSRSCSLTFQG